MKSRTLTVTAHAKAKPGKEDELRQALLSLVAPSLKDAGCVNYDVHQALENSGSFLFHENWENESMFEAHMQQPHIQRVLASLGQLVAEPPQIVLWEKIS